jgi:lipid-A-disaccharide synthase
MRYYLIAGEASGDLHASHLMNALKQADPEAEFRFFGGDLMAAQGGVLVKHYRELAYMGFIPVLMHLPTILRNMSFCKKDIKEWNPHVVILIDYPGFNLSIAKYVHAQTQIPVYYYIAPKLWAWKEYRIKNIQRDVDELFSILPFEVPFFEKKHHYPIHYVGNPTAHEVHQFLNEHQPSPTQPTIALLAGSRLQEIKDNLPAMIEAAEPLANDYQLVVAGAPGVEPSYYDSFIHGKPVSIVFGQTYELLMRSTAALVTSGTATLETALFHVPQVVCYKTPVPHLVRWAYNHIIKCKYISLVNLITDKEVVPELLADRFSVSNIRTELLKILPGKPARNEMLEGYKEVETALGNGNAPQEATRLMISLLKERGRKQ